MAYSYFDMENLKLIQDDSAYDSWLDSFKIPKTKEWIDVLSAYLIKQYQCDELRLKVVLNQNIDLAYKIYIIYIQERNHPNTQNYHATFKQSALINLLENIENCDNGNNERLSTIIANFYCSANNIKSFIQAYRRSLIELIVCQYFATHTHYNIMEVHINAAFQRAANEVLGFNIDAPARNMHNQFTNQQINFLLEAFAQINIPLKLIEYIESQFAIPDLSTGNIQNKIDDFDALLRRSLLLHVDKYRLFIENEETGQWHVDKKYIIQLICQKLCKLGVFKESFILKAGQYILPKPDVKNKNDFLYWLNHLATEEDKKNLNREEKKIFFLLSTINGDTQGIKSIIDDGFDLNSQDQNGNAALIWAVKNGHTEIVSQLLAQGAEVNILNKYWSSANNPFKDDLLMNTLFYTLQVHKNAQYQKEIRQLIANINQEPNERLEHLKFFNEHTNYRWAFRSMFWSSVFLPYTIIKRLILFILDVYQGNPAFQMLLMTQTQRMVVKIIKDLEESQKTIAPSPSS